MDVSGAIGVIGVMGAIGVMVHACVTMPIEG